jgi:abortive infection bacteriophage resistance protein
MTLPTYNKPHISPAQIVTQLQNRGLDIPDSDLAAETIDRMGYTHLRMYLNSRCDMKSKGRPFRAGTSLQDIMQIYECDFKLRATCFDAVGQFELLLRNTISEILSEGAGSHPHDNAAVFKKPKAQKKILKIFKETYDQQKGRDGLAKEYHENYGSPPLPPIWDMKEMLTFGDIAELLISVNNPIEARIARQFGGPNQYLFRNWVYALIDLRNLCAHHDRLFNRTFQKTLSRWRFNEDTVPTSGTRDDKLAGLLQCLDHVMNVRGVPVNAEEKVNNILQDYPKIDRVEVGYSSTAK